jgi:hypothetical protein
VAIFNSTAPCPYCYTEINPRKLAYRCSGRHHPDRPSCEKEADPVRQSYFNDADWYWPVIKPIGSASIDCPGCGARPGPSVCPECHSLLPAEFSVAHLQVGVVGARNSGKSVFLGALDAEIQEVAAELDGSCDAAGPGNRHLRTWWSLVEKRGQLPGQTASSHRPMEPAVYSWRSADGRRARGATFSVADYSGSDFTHGGTVKENAALSYVGSSAAILLLLDPFGFPTNRERANTKGALVPDTGPEAVLDAITMVLRNAKGVKRNKKIEQPISVVVSKIDGFADHAPAVGEGSRAFAGRQFPYRSSEVRAMLAEWGAGDLTKTVETEFSRVRYFGVSALGAEPDYGGAEVLSLSTPRPYGVAGPLLWFMADKGLARSKHLDQVLKESV